MALKSFVSIKFLNEKPNKKELKRLNKILKRLDYDAPEFNENGFYGFWRKPNMFKEIMNLIHCYGYPVSYQYIHDAYNTYYKYWDAVDENPKETVLTLEDWIEFNLSETKTKYSQPKSLDKNHMFYKIVRKLSRRF